MDVHTYRMLKFSSTTGQKIKIIVTLIIVTLAQWARTAQSKNDQKWNFLAFLALFW